MTVPGPSMLVRLKTLKRLISRHDEESFVVLRNARLAILLARHPFGIPCIIEIFVRPFEPSEEGKEKRREEKRRVGRGGEERERGHGETFSLNE